MFECCLVEDEDVREGCEEEVEDYAKDPGLFVSEGVVGVVELCLPN